MVKWSEAIKYSFKISTFEGIWKLIGFILILIGITLISKAIFLVFFKDLINTFLQLISALKLLGIDVSKYFQSISEYTLTEFYKDMIYGAILFLIGSIIKGVGDAAKLKYFVELIKKELKEDQK